MKSRNYLVIQGHTSEYLEPLTFTKGAVLAIGEKYEGSEGWENWVFCESQEKKGGWVPTQMIESTNGKVGRALEGFTTKELNVKVGDVLAGFKHLNGWVWCSNSVTSESGWVPLALLQEVQEVQN